MGSFSVLNSSGAPFFGSLNCKLSAVLAVLPLQTLLHPAVGKIYLCELPALSYGRTLLKN